MTSWINRRCAAPASIRKTGRSRRWPPRTLDSSLCEEIVDDNGKAFLAPYDLRKDNLQATGYPMETLGSVFGGRIPYSRTTTAIIGGAQADVSFIGLAPGFVGLGQANLVIPAGSATGDNVAVVITIDGQASNSANVSVR